MDRPDDIERWSPLKVWFFTLLNRTPASNLAAVDLAGLGPDDRFLDLGCGAGAAMERAVATGAAVAGVDPSPAMVERATKRVPTAEVAVGSAESIPFPDDRFTVVLTVASYHHWADTEAGFAEIRRVLAPGGRLLIVERRLRRTKGHGITTETANNLVASIPDHGYATADLATMKAGRTVYLVITAVVPA